MRRIRRHVAAMAWVMVALMLASCSSYQQLPLDSHPDPEDISFVVRGLNMGDHVRIRTRSNETLRGRVIGWNEKEIEITNDRGPQTIPLRHVCSVERITPSPGKTGVLVLGVAGSLVLGFFLAVMVSVGGRLST